MRDTVTDVAAAQIFSTNDAKAKKTIDGFDNFVSRLGLNNNNTLSAGFYTFNLLTRNRIQLEAAYRGSWIVGKIIDCVAEDMTRAGIEVQTNEDDSDIKDLMSKISRLQISQSFCSLVKWARLYGGALGVIQIDGQRLDTPLDISTVGKNQFKGIVVYDRWQLNPDLGRVIKSGPDIGLPEYYSIVNDPTQLEPDAPTQTGQTLVHHSRCIRMIGIQLPYFQAITEMMWGESVLERLWDRLISFDNVTMSAASLVDRANLRMVGIEGLREILAAGGPAKEALYSQFEMMRLMQVNEGLTLLDKNDAYQASAYSFAGLSDMMIQFSQQLSGACDTPLTRLFGQSPAGLNATGESDIRMYYDMIKAQQESRLRDGWDKVLKIMWRSVFEKDAPKDLDFEFVPLWQMSAVDKANIAKTNAESIIGAFEAGLVAKPSAMKELRDSSDETGVFSNISDEEIKEAEDDPLPAPGEIDPGLEGEEPAKISTPIPALK